MEEPQQYPRCMIKVADETYKCSLNKFQQINIPDSQLPIYCNICPLAKALAESIVVNSEDKKTDSIKYPSAFGLVKNFGKAMINYAKSGFKNVTPKQYKERLGICQGDESHSRCENYDEGRCKHPECGCFLASKAWIFSQDCPLKKWPELKEENSNQMEKNDQT